MTKPVDIRRKAEDMAYALGIALYITPEGRLEQLLPEGANWERVEPPKGAVPVGHGHGQKAEASSAV